MMYYILSSTTNTTQAVDTQMSLPWADRPTPTALPTRTETSPVGSPEAEEVNECETTPL